MDTSYLTELFILSLYIRGSGGFQGVSTPARHHSAGPEPSRRIKMLAPLQVTARFNKALPDFFTTTEMNLRINARLLRIIKRKILPIDKVI